MKAALLVEPGKIELREVALPDLAAGEVMIQPIRTGICGSDVSFYLGHRRTPHSLFTLGHEVVGRVTAVADGVTRLIPGQRVIVEPNYPCGKCKLCRKGRGNICPHKESMGVTVQGSFAEYVTAPAEFVWALPDSISDADAATIEPLAVSLHAIRQSGTHIGDTVAVVGCGVVGLLLIHAAVAQGVRVVAYDPLKAKANMASRLGATVCDKEDLAASWASEDVGSVFECAGVASAVELAIGAAPRGSQVILLGLSTSPASFQPLDLVRKGIRIEPSLIYDHPADFARSIELVANETLHPSTIVDETFEFDSIAKAMELAANGESGKIHTIIS